MFKQNLIKIILLGLLTISISACSILTKLQDENNPSDSVIEMPLAEGNSWTYIKTISIEYDEDVLAHYETQPEDETSTLNYIIESSHSVTPTINVFKIKISNESTTYLTYKFWYSTEEGLFEYEDIYGYYYNENSDQWLTFDESTLDLFTKILSYSPEDQDYFNLNTTFGSIRVTQVTQEGVDLEKHTWFSENGVVKQETIQYDVPVTITGSSDEIFSPLGYLIHTETLDLVEYSFL